MEILYEEIRKFFNKRYNFFSLLGYFIGALNFYISALIISKYQFSLLFYIFISLLFFVFNFVFAAITSLYIDIQSDECLRASEIFYFYGLSEYLTLLFIPLTYFIEYKTIYGFKYLMTFSIFFLIWLLRIWLVKKKSGLGVINSIIAVFFPQILIITVGVILIAISWAIAFLQIYA